MKKVMWLTIMAVSLLFFTGSCRLNPETALNDNPGTQEATMQLNQDPVASRTIPPIDAAAPAEVETATFGLG